MTNTNDKNPQAPQTQSTTNGPTSTITTPRTTHQPKPDAEENEARNSNPNKAKDLTTTGAPTKQPLDPNNPQANNDKTEEPVADEATSKTKA